MLQVADAPTVRPIDQPFVPLPKKQRVRHHQVVRQPLAHLTGATSQLLRGKQEQRAVQWRYVHYVVVIC